MDPEELPDTGEEGGGRPPCGILRSSQRRATGGSPCAAQHGWVATLQVCRAHLAEGLQGAPGGRPQLSCLLHMGRAHREAGVVRTRQQRADGGSDLINACALPPPAARSVCVDRARGVARRGPHRRLLPPADEGAAAGSGPAACPVGPPLPSRGLAAHPPTCLARVHRRHRPALTRPPHRRPACRPCSPQLVDYNLMAWATAVFAPYMADFKRYAKKD